MAVSVSSAIGCGSSLEKALSMVAATGATGVDLLTIGSWAHVNPADLAADYTGVASRLDGLLKAAGLSLLALNTGTTVQLHDRSGDANTARAAQTEALCRLMSERGVKTAAIQPLQPDRKRDPAEVMRDCIASLRQQYAIAERHGVRLAVELHVNSPFESVAEAQALLREMPEVRVVYDPTHFVMQGIPLAETTWIMDRAIHVHARDAGKGKLQAPLGEGEIDFDWMAAALRDRGFAGNVSVEYLQTDTFDVIDSAKRLYDRMCGLFA